MKKLLLGSVALIMLSAPVLAADMPVKVKVLPPAWSWTGCYVGLNVGYGWARFKKSEVHRVLPTNFNYADFDFDDDGALGGAQAGCNWQNGQWVFGVEADIQVTSIEARSYFDNALFNVPIVNETDSEAHSAVRWFGTVRGRLGWTVTPTTLLYVTGGFAYGHVSSSFHLPTQAGAPTARIGFDSQTHFGWTVGVGGEAKIAQNFTAKFEYLYVDLGSQDYTFANIQTTGVGLATYAWNQRVDLHVVRVGLNYQFDWYTPVIAKY